MSETKIRNTFYVVKGEKLNTNESKSLYQHQRLILK